MDRRRFVIGTSATAIAAGSSLSHPASAQDAFPTRPINIVNAFPPGGINDIVTRPFAESFSAALKQPVVIETKAGAGGQIGAQVGAAAKPDGYTLLSHNNGINSYEEVDKQFGRPAKTTRADFIPLARLVADPVLFVVNAEAPQKTLKEFLDDAKAKPESFVYSSGGLYGASHVPETLLEKIGALPKQLRHLPTAGGGPAITALLGKNVQFSTQTTTATLQHIKSGKLRALASYGGQRSKTLPDVPTLKELGIDLEYYLWVGIFAPKNTPANIVAILSAAIEKAANADQFKSALTNIGMDLDYMNSVAFAKFWESDSKNSDEAVKFIGRIG